jgi:hypothetical protein
MEPYADGELRIDVVRKSADRLSLEWRGRSNARDPQRTLGPWLTLLLDEAQRAKASLELHFESLAYFNSSTVAALLQFVAAARQLRTPLDLSYDAQLRWQRQSFEALQVLATLDRSISVHPAIAAPGEPGADPATAPRP